MIHNCGVAKVPQPTSLVRPFRVSWPLLLGLAGFLFPICIRWGLGDPDTYWHVAAGGWMLEHRAVPTHDPFSFTMPGAAWTAHEWLSELLLAVGYQISGWSGLVFLTAACFGVTLALLSRFLLARMEPLHALQLTCLAGLMMFTALLARPHVLVWPLTAVWVAELIDSSEAHRPPSWWLLAVILPWANMHASFIVGLGLMVLIAIDSIIRAEQSRWETAKRWAPFVLAAFACVLINPQGYRLLLFPFHLLGMTTALGLIAEWRPPDFAHPQLLSPWLFVVLGLAFAGRLRLSLIRSILLIGLLSMAMAHARNIALLGLISPYLLALPIATAWKQQPPAGRNADFIDRCFHRLATRASLPAVFLTLFIGGGAAVATLATTRPHPADATTPREALATLLSRAPHARIFNDYAFGGYLIFRGIPVFVDGRADMYGDAFIGQIFDDMVLAPGSDLESLMGKFRIDAILLNADRPAVKLLDRMPAWERVYADKMAVAYIRRSGPGS